MVALAGREAIDARDVLRNTSSMAYPVSGQRLSAQNRNVMAARHHADLPLSAGAGASSNAPIVARKRSISSWRPSVGGIGSPTTILITPGRLRKARRPQHWHWPESVATGMIGNLVHTASAATPGYNSRTLPGSLRLPSGKITI
jgi:hypothetical protein